MATQNIQDRCTVRGVARGAVRRFETALGVVGVLALIVTGILTTGWNPLPGVADWWDRVAASTAELSDPAPSWVHRVGGQPSAAVVADDAVIVTMRGTVEARGLRSGEVLWQREADWVGVAGDASNTVAVVGRRGAGLEAVDPTTGVPRWKEAGAVGAWMYRDVVLTLSCGGLSDCTLAARTPHDGTQRWKVILSGVGRVHAGANSELLGSRELSSTYRDALGAAPGPIPPALGFPIDQRVQVVDTRSGRRLLHDAPGSGSRMVVVGGRLLISSAVPREGNCRYSLEARDTSTGRTVWRKDGYDLRTASGAGCEQRKDPAGSDDALIATRGDNREVFLSPRDGRELWVAQPGESLVTTDGRYGLVRSADRKILKLIVLGDGSKAWERPVPDKAHLAITSYSVLVGDPAAGRIIAYEIETGRQQIEAETGGEVLGYGPTGLMIGRGRTIGFLPFA